MTGSETDIVANASIRVAHVVGKVITGGVDAVVMNYYRHIDHEKVQFDFLMDGYHDTPVDDEIKHLGGKIYKLEPYEKNMLRNMRQCYKIFKDGRYQIVHAHLNTLSVFPLCAAWLAGVPVRIAHNHSTAHKGEGKRTLMKQLLRPLAKLFANRYAACSRHAGEWLFGKHSYANGRVKLIRNAIDVDRFLFSSSVRKEVREELGLKNMVIIGNIGRFIYQKNHSFLLDIFAEVKRREPNAVLLLVGTGELLDDIREKAARLELTDSVIFTGVRHDVNRLYQAMDVFVFPSWYEGLGLVAIEAQVAGLPTILSNMVPEEAKINECGQFVSLEASAAFWAEQVLKCQTVPRQNMKSSLGATGYEIRAAARELEAWYGGQCR